MGKKVVRIRVEGEGNSQTVHVNHNGGNINELTLLRQRIEDLERIIEALKMIIDEKEKIIQLMKKQHEKNHPHTGSEPDHPHS